MKITVKNISCLLLMVLIRLSLFAQQGFYIPANARIFFNGDSSTIFSDVINYGNVGLGKNAIVNFNGENWENKYNALITDESDNGYGVSGIGGLLRFTGITPQYVTGGYNAAAGTGTSFGNIEIKNVTGVFLSNGSTKIRHHLSFKTGHLYLMDNILTVGHNYPGKITGYDSIRFIVTNNKAGEGFLIRENIRSSDGTVVFPVGAGILQYTPAAVKSKSADGASYYVSVFDKVFDKATAGQLMQINTVNTTWQIGRKSVTQGIHAEILLQHLRKKEGGLFAANRKLAYVSMFTDDNWDDNGQKTEPSMTNLGSRSIWRSIGVNQRLVRNNTFEYAYFTKTYGKIDDNHLKNQLWFSGYRNDDRTVYLSWVTKPEINNEYFILERKTANENDYSTIDTIYSKSGGYNLDSLHYNYTDDNNFKGVTYYRITMVSGTGEHTITKTIAIGPKVGKKTIIIWPNPSSGKFRIAIVNYPGIKSVVIWTIIGQKLMEEKLNDRTIIDMELLTPGTYIVGFVGDNGLIVESKKLLIVPKK